VTDTPFAAHLPEHPEDDAAREARHQVLATLLAAYADGELPVETASQVDAHLLGCGRCRSELRVQRAVGARLARSTVPTATLALQSRIRAAIADTEVPPAHPNVSTPSRFRKQVLLFAVLAGIAVAGVWAWKRDAVPSLNPPPLVARSSTPALRSIIDNYRSVTQGDLPGRARDLDAVRSALPFVITPLTDPEAHLLAAWTADLDGEPAGVLAYRWREQVVLQYIVGESALFRARDVRAAIAERRAVVVQDGTLGLLAWPETNSGSVLVGDVPWRDLVALHQGAAR
jgi:anti-sigma factor RsiW